MEQLPGGGRALRLEGIARIKHAHPAKVPAGAAVVEAAAEARRQALLPAEAGLPVMETSFTMTLSFPMSLRGVPAQVNATALKTTALTPVKK